MITADTEYRERMEQFLRAAIVKANGELTAGYADSFENYRYRVGFIRALTQVLEACPEIEKSLGS